MRSDHCEHCRACKQRVSDLLAAIYGQCRTNCQFPWPAKPADYERSVIGDVLRRIQSGLGDLRGHRDFIKSALMPPCDYFVVDPPFVVEFDENQHFSPARLVTLMNYPEKPAVGFWITRWQNLCREINAQDDTPIDRDERRAWYDTLRDLLPPQHGFKPTVRLYAGALEWCALDPAKPADREAFRQLIGS
jgi:hypothetical protein